MLRRRELTQVYVGVYVNHTGRLTRSQHRWAAVLAFWPAALTLESALPGHPLDVVKVAVDLSRRVKNLPRVWVYPTSDLHQRTDWRAGPPTIGLEHATIDVMSRRIGDTDVAGAFSTLAEVCHTRRTTPERIATILDERARIAGRSTIAALLADRRDGACSVLERGYLNLVERAHGLPRGSRQVRSDATGRRTYQDVHYKPYGVIVEPDGLAWHDGTVARTADARRDLAELAVSSALTARVTYGLVFREGCWTAAMIAALLIRQGWPGPFRRCPKCPRDLEVLKP
ncbi:hypothetical protein ASD81_17540 [Nocardioides sp. Root614]|nr:hypothetical protein ASD81_17540 [Nocardioides sp. Root614]KRA88449.1 hypothetical protein ASD84_17815 [Nocardioides sp. Root682]